MTLRNFQIFIEVCNQGTMSAAAQKLFISQSAVSQIIKDMENHYGVVLFQRISHKLYLTEAGKKLYSHAIKMVQYNELIESSMADSSKTTTLRIGTISAYMMIDIIVEYKKYHPELSVSMINNTRSILDMLLYSGQLDVAIASGLFNLTNYEFYPLSVFDAFFACSRYSKLSPLFDAEEPEISIEELSRFPIYVNAISEDDEQTLNSAFLSHGIHYNVAGTFLHYDALVKIAIEDLGVILINQTNFEQAKRLLKKIKVRDLNVKNTISLICSRENASNPVISDFIHFTLNHFERLKNSYMSKYYPGLTENLLETRKEN